MGKTSIEWTDRTWNPTRGCSRVSEGCRNCYAERQAARNLPGMKSPTNPLATFAIQTSDGPRWTGKVELIKSKLTEPLHWKKPCRVFVNSMSDLFHEALSNRDIARVFRTICECRGRHTFQILTKRAARLPDWFAWAKLNYPGWFHPETGALDLWNTWIGVSVENQVTADERIPFLLQTPAAIRFVSYEPALGPVDFFHVKGVADMYAKMPDMRYVNVDWVIIGGESGPGARPFRIQWARDVIAQCKTAGVACFMKQLGAKPFDNYIGYACENDPNKGGDPQDWPRDLQVREFPKITGLADL